MLSECARIVLRIIICFDKVLFAIYSSSQVVGHLLEMFETTGWVPELLGYDDGCHLHGFIHRPERVSEWAANPVWQKLLLMHIFIDRFHFPNHVDTWCKANMSADRCADTYRKHANVSHCL